MKYFLMIILITTITRSHAQNISFNVAKPYLEAFQTQVEIPTAYHFYSVSEVKSHNQEAYLFRYQKDENKGLNGEHFSFLIAKADKKVLGYTHMNKKYNKLNMVSRKEAKQIATDFITKLDKSLANDVKNLWIERHDEQLFVDNGKATTVAGMKYKCYRSSFDDYAWVIVGFDGSIVTFERDIKWNNNEHRRITDKWLHDSWILEHDAHSKNKSALILIEAQNEWMHPNGKLRQLLVADEQMMLKSIANMEKALQYARNNNIAVIHVGLRFEKGYPEMGNAKSGLRKAIPNAQTFPIGGFGSQFYKTVAPIEGEFIVTGRTGASGFTGSNLDAFLRNNEIDNLYLVGYATHVCVESTLREAHDKGYNTILLSDACAAFNQSQQDYVLNEIVHHFGLSMTTKAFVNEH